ncbi:hypothetical protein EGW08_019284 [Elysia chlorotica]|uniref:Endonuclease/exonuclease/phosphatase domain-containing protein n=1 Tax=Elysia chlorotica TaxID=188477 RepID=A0A3S1H611_ELYCH|nr:hypothetical protein EGW08_019284 [Elysia chlorotica]
MTRNILKNNVNDVKEQSVINRPLSSGRDSHVLQVTPDRHQATACKLRMKIATWNVKTMAQKGKLENIKQEMERLKWNKRGTLERSRYDKSEVQVGSDKLDVVASFCYLGDMLSAAGGCDLATTTRVKTAWKKFKELLPVLLSRHLSYKTRGHVYSTCVRSAMLHASETWPLTKPNLQRLQRNDRAMIRQICNVKPEDVATTRSNELLTLLGLEDLNLILKERRLRWYGHVERSSGAIKTALDMQVTGSRGKGRPRMTWKQVTERDRKDWKLSTTDPHDRTPGDLV